MSRLQLILLGLALLFGCYRGSEIAEGPFTCSTGRECASDMVCDDGLCCRPGATPACPTLASPDGSCANGSAPQTYYLDEDRDGHGDPDRPVQLCATPATSFVSSLGDDCEDDPREGGALTFPGAREQCDGRDNDCDGQVDFEFFKDSDGDGYGDPAAAVTSCTRPADFVENEADCAPSDFSRNPGAAEVCNKLDDDCDGIPDNGLATTTWYEDKDGDGFGAATSTESCFQPPGYRSSGKDCDDSDPARFPRNFEACDGLPNDCDVSIDERPDCGGQVNLIAPGTAVTYGAQETGVLATDLNDFQHCFKGWDPTLPLFQTETFAPPGWGAFGGTAHVMWVETARGWDLRQAGKALNLDFRANYGGNAADTGSANDTWGTLNQPIVILCDADNNWRRFRPTTNVIDGGAPNWVSSIPVAASGGSITQTVSSSISTGSWVMFESSARPLDLSRVVRVEVLLQMRDVDGDGVSPYFNATISKLGF